MATSASLSSPHSPAHPVTTARCRTGLPAALNAEWTALREDPHGVATVRRWVAAEPALRDARTLVDVERLAGSAPSDQVLAALLRLAQNGDRLAARTLLQLHLGAAINLARRTCHHAGGDLEEAQARAISALWEAIARYPLPRRRGNHAAGLALDVLRQLTAHTDNRPGRARRLLEVPREGLREELEGRPEPAPAVDATRQVEELLRWAVRKQVLTSEDATLLRRLHTSADGAGRELTQAAVARELGMTHTALRQRSSRATRKLAEAIRAGRPAPTTSKPAVTAAA